MAKERNAHPAKVKKGQEKEDIGRFDFNTNQEDDRLERISWDDFLKNLALRIYNFFTKKNFRWRYKKIL